MSQSRSRTSLPDHAYRQVLEAVGQAAVVIDLDGAVNYWNPEAERLYGWSAAEALGRPIRDLILPPDGSDALITSVMASLVDGGRYDGDWEVTHRDGRRLTVHASSCRIVDGDGVPLGFACLAHDVTAVRSAHEEALHLADALSLVERRWRARFETPGLAQVICDPEGRVLQVNQAACDLFGRRADEVVGRFTRDFHHPGDLRAGEQMAAAPGADGASWERVFALPDGTPLPLLVTLGVVRDSAGEPESTISVMQDLRRVHRLEEAARDAALEQQRLRLHDPLTGLGNRKLLEARLATDAARALTAGRPVALLVVGLDDFALVNDSEGHAVGDRLLQVVAERLAGATDSGDTLVRVGGASFGVLSPGLDAPRAVELAGRIRAIVARPAEVEGRSLRVAASVGLAVAHRDDGWEDLLRAADTAMHEAKSRGGDRIAVFDPALADAAARRLNLLSDLRTALETGEGLRLDYQPQVELASSRVVGVEALARWTHPQLGELAPAAFIPMALAHGLAGSLDEWAMRSAAADLPAVCAALGHEVTVSVNVTATSLASGHVVEVVRSLDLPPGSLTLELTEHLLLDDPVPARVAIEQLRDLGVTVSVDDFGTGASTLQSVVELPVHELKIDRSFVAGVARDRSAHAVAASIAALARALGLRVVAEGVETEAQARSLALLGVPVAQGWLYGAAVPVDQLGKGTSEPVTCPKAAGAVPRGAAWFPAAAVGDEHGLYLLHRLAGEGLSPASIAAALNADGWRTPARSRWHRTTVTRVLREHEDAQSTR